MSTERAEIYSDLTGVITMMYVDDGCEVEEGEKILGIECMKMIHDVYAPFAGKFIKKCELGETVGENDVVAFVEIEV